MAAVDEAPRYRTSPLRTPAVQRDGELGNAGSHVGLTSVSQRLCRGGRSDNRPETGAIACEFAVWRRPRPRTASRLQQLAQVMRRRLTARVHHDTDGTP